MITLSKNPRLRAMMTEFGDQLKDFIEARRRALSERAVKGSTEFETLWNVAENEGRRHELKQLFDELSNL